MSDGHEKSDIRDRIERGFAAWGHMAYRRAGWVIALALLGTAALASQLSELWIETSTESFFRESDPARVTYDRFRAQFGQDVLIVVAIKPPRVFDLAFLEKLRALHEDVENDVPRLVEVTSLISARQTRGEGDELIVGDFLEDWPQTPEALAELERRAMANPFYANNIVSEEGDFTALVIDAFAIAGQAIVGKELGADSAAVARAVSNRLLALGFSFGVLLAIVLLLASPWLGSWFTSDGAVVAAFASILPILILMQPINGIVFVWDGIAICVRVGRRGTDHLLLGGGETIAVWIVIRRGDCHDHPGGRLRGAAIDLGAIAGLCCHAHRRRRRHRCARWRQ